MFQNIRTRTVGAVNQTGTKYLWRIRKHEVKTCAFFSWDEDLLVLGMDSFEGNDTISHHVIYKKGLSLIQGYRC